jgi:hypothetical protein
VATLRTGAAASREEEGVRGRERHLSFTHLNSIKTISNETSS